MAADSIVAEVTRLTALHADRRGALLPLLHEVQAALGWLPNEAVPAIAEGLNLTRAEVHGAISFYADFRRSPPPRHMVRWCRAEACQARGGAAMAKAAARRLGVAMGETRADGAVALEPAYCLGLCATGPNAMIDGAPHSRIDEAKLDAFAKELGL